MMSKSSARRRTRPVRRSHGRLLRCEVLENRALLNAAPTIALANLFSSSLELAENRDMTARLRIADVVISDDGQGTNVLGLAGEDKDLFQIDGNSLYLKAGTELDYETTQQLDVIVTVDDTSVGQTPDDTETLSIAITNVNDAPVLTVPASGPTVTEGANATGAISGISVADPDAASGQMTVTLGIPSVTGTLSVGTVSGGVSIISGNNTHTVTLTGARDQINTTLASSVTYTVPGAEFSGTVTLTVTANDNGNMGTGGAKIDTKTVAITVAGNNDPPTLAVPESLSLTEDDAKTVAGISITDPDAGTGDVRLMLSVSHGKLSVLTNVSGGLTDADVQGSGTASLVLRGTVAEINATLAASSGLMYVGSTNYAGTDTLTARVNDLGSSGNGDPQEDIKTVPITIGAFNDVPALTVPSAKTVAPNTDLPISGISVSDVDAGDAEIEVKLTVLHGTLTVQTDVANGLVVQNNASKTVTLTGSQAKINATLAANDGLKYRGDANYTGTDTLTVASNDKGNGPSGSVARTDSKTVALTVSAPNQAPTLSVPGTQAATEDTEKEISGISVADADAGTADIELKLQVSNGKLMVRTDVASGLSVAAVQGYGTATVTLTGSVAKINATLAASGGLKYLGQTDYNGSDTLTVTANDKGNSGSGGAKSASKTVAISLAAVNDGPVITVPGAQTAAEEADLAISGISVTDPDAGTANILVTLSVTHGKLTVKTDVSGGLTSANITNNGTKTVTLQGSYAKINATLAASGGLKYRGDADFTGAETLTVSANDLGSTGTGGPKTATNKTVAITVSDANDAPVVTVPASQTVPKDTERAITGISIADSDAGAGQIEVTLEASHGKLKVLTNVSGGLAAGGVTGNETAKVVLKGTLTQINATLAAANGLKYIPTTGYTGSDALKVKADDKGNSGAGGAKQDQETVAILVGSSSLSGYVYIDVNNDGSILNADGERTELGLPGATVKLRQKNATSGNYTDFVTVKTGPDGYYQFDNLPAGTYEIVETQPDRFMDGKEMAGNLGGTVEDNRITNIVVKAGDQGRGYDFCERGLKLRYIGMQLFLGSAPSAYQVAAEYAGLKAVTISGTAGNDDIQFIAGTDSHKVIVNGQERVYAASSVDMFTIDAGAGSDKVVLNGTSGADTARILPGRSTLRGTNYMVEAIHAEDVKIDGKEGDDDGTLYDSEGNDALTTAGNKATVVGSNYLAQLIAFERVRAISERGGNDTAQQATDFVLMLEGDWN